MNNKGADQTVHDLAHQIYSVYKIGTKKKSIKSIRSLEKWQKNKKEHENLNHTDLLISIAGEWKLKVVINAGQIHSESFILIPQKLHHPKGCWSSYNESWYQNEQFPYCIRIWKLWFVWLFHENYYSDSFHLTDCHICRMTGYLSFDRYVVWRVLQPDYIQTDDQNLTNI